MVMALSLLSLVFLLVISLINLVSTDLSLADVRKERILAKAHARMGMMIALGEIQKHLGPDMRISATADLLDERIESGKIYESNLYQEDANYQRGIDLNENGEIDPLPFGNRFWTGVWKHRGRDRGVDSSKLGSKPFPENLDTGDSLSEYPMVSTEFDPHPAIEVSWLVSGNEGYYKKLFFGSSPYEVEEFVEIPDGNLWDDDDPDKGRYFLSGGVFGNDENAWEDYSIALQDSSLLGNGDIPKYAHPLFELPDPTDSDEVVWLLKSPLLKNGYEYDPDFPDAWKNLLSAEPVKVPKTRIKNAAETVDESEFGSYAYWVGDEGVKTKINLSNPNKNSTDDQIRRDNLTVANEPNLSFSDEAGSDVEISGFEFEFSSEAELNRKKITSVGLMSKLQLDSDDEDFKDKLSAHFHSLTADSHGVLADLRTGGLKRDLSSAFANEEDWNLRNNAENWADDFRNYIFKDRIFYQKSVPLESDSPENDWRLGSDQTLLEEHGLLAGPRWTTLGTFHNKYLSSSFENDYPDEFPRIVGDNSVLFNHLFPFGVKPNSPGNSPSISTTRLLRQNFNYFRGLEVRPEPRNHPIQPILVEIKYSHQPIFQNGQIGLALYPSVAFWNPYNIPILSKELFVEIPMDIGFHAMNAKHYDLYRKWWMYSFDNSAFDSYNIGNPTSVPFEVPSGFKNFEDKNGNGKQDPGERYFGANWNPSANREPATRENFFRFYNFKEPHPYPRSNTLKLPTDNNSNYTYHDFVGNALGQKIEQKFLNSRNPEFQGVNGDRHLLLRIENIELEPGEKAHFTVSASGNPSFTWSPLPQYPGSAFVQVELDELTSGSEDTPFVCLSGNFNNLAAEDPLTIRFWCWGFRGVHPNAKEAYDAMGQRLQVSNLVNPKGITVYSENPDGVSPESRKIVTKINKEFKIEIGSGLCDFARCDDLFLSNGSNLSGQGFRIRFKLPGDADKVVLEQFNVRALIHGNQEGYGDNWEVEEFSSMNAYGLESKPFDDDEFGNGSFQVGTQSWVIGSYLEFFTLPELDDDVVLDLSSFTQLNPYLSGLDLSINAVVPRVSIPNNSIGFFHEYDELGEMLGEDRAILFEMPTSPMLSMLQFRHANLNNYAHGPSYVLGNSYASPQVSRYRTWGKMKAFQMQPIFPGMNIPENISVATTLQNAGFRYNPFPWLPERMVSYDDPIRDKFVKYDHQNVTLDHSLYANNSLLDGYFLSGLGINDEAWEMKDASAFDFGDRYLPFRNTRLIPYYREAEWKSTSYSSLQPALASSGSDSDFRYQTLAADLLLNGAFNVNSTSVDAWASQLASLRGLPVSGATVSKEETPVPRFLEYPGENSWNKLRKLSDDEISLLAHKMVEQIKLRGPFLSYADFVNRRIQGNTVNLLGFPFSEWDSKERAENRSSVLGLRGAVQAAISDAGINAGEFSNNDLTFAYNPSIPSVPNERFSGIFITESPWPLASEMNFNSSRFGIHAFSKSLKSYNGYDSSSGNLRKFSDYLTYPLIAQAHWDPMDIDPSKPNSFFVTPQKWGKGFYEVKYENPSPPVGKILMPDGSLNSFKYHFTNFEDTFYYGEAPENLLAVENVASGANTPGWVMQSDLLSPLVPVTAARSDTFIIRVMGENKKKRDSETSTKAWIELTVQRVPDFLKADLDNPHHRPHEPFEDRNFNGYWDPDIDEHWVDLNQNSVERERDGTTSQKIGAYPDLASDNPTFADGLESDLGLNKDPDEEDVSNSAVTISRMGINQRFGRDFKIIKFRWLNAKDV